MTLHTYRYRQGSPFTNLDLQRHVASSATVTQAAGGPIFDVQIDDVQSNALANLDEYMTIFGYGRIVDDPVGTPSSQVRLADGTILTFVTPADTQYLQRSGTTIVGSAAVASGYTTVQEGGGGLTARSTLNAASGIVATDDVPNTRTNLDLDYGLVGDLSSADIGDAASAGTNVRVARSDHQHALPAPAAPADVTKATAATGSALTAARADHKHDILTAAPSVSIKAGDAAAEGSATSVTRTDHQHAVSTAVVGDLAVADAGAASAGTATVIPRGDHKHQVSTAAPTVTIKSEATATATGSATTLLRSDAQIQAATAAPTVTVKSEATAAGQGAASTLLRTDAQIQAATAAPTITIKSENTAAAQGTASTLLRSDAQIQAATAAPTVTVKSEVTAAGQGVANTMLRSDAQLQVATATVVSVASANTQGTASTVARSDHTHKAAWPILAWGNGNVAGTTTTRYLTPSFENDVAATTPVQIRSPSAGSIRNMRVRHNTTAGNGNAIVYTVRVAGSASALTISLASTSADGSDLTHTVTVAAGDLLDIEVTKASSVGTSPSDITVTLEMIVT